MVPGGTDSARERPADLLGNRKASGQDRGGPHRGPTETRSRWSSEAIGGDVRGIRTATHRLRRASQRLSYHARHMACGRPLAAEVDLLVRHRENGPRAGIGGLESCGRMWECVACSTRLLSKRAGGIVRALADHRAAGGESYLVTLTQRRPASVRVAGDEGEIAWEGPPTLQMCLDRYREAWARARRQICRYLGRDYVRAVEVTWGESGWHLHAHLLVLFPRPLDDEELSCLRARLATTWAAAYDDAPAWRPSLERGVDVSTSSAARYLTKLGLEVADASKKRAKSANRWSMAQVLELADNPRSPWQSRARSAWREYVATMTGVRRLVYGQHLSRDVRQKMETEDAERVGTIPSRAYREIRRRMDWLDCLLAHVERGELAALPDALVRLGASHRLASELVSHAESRERARVEHDARRETTWHHDIVPIMGW